MSANKTSNSNGIRTLVTIGLAVSWSSLAALQDGPTVTGVHPISQSMVPVEGLRIVVDVDRAVAPQSLDGRSFWVFGRWSGVCPGQLSLENGNQRLLFTPAKSFSAGEWITVSLSTSIASSGGANMATGYAWNFWTTSRPGSLQLVKKATIKVQRPDEPPIRTYGAYAGDLKGDGAGHFLSHKTYPVGAGTRGLAVLDLDGDGATDIVTANRADGTISVLLNRGDGQFLPARDQDTGTERETACAAADFNEDGILDVAVGSYSFGLGEAQPSGDIVILLGDGHGRLSPPRLYRVGRFPLAVDVGDLDGDHDLDLVTSNFGSRSWTLYENDGRGHFSYPRTFLTSAAGSCAVLHDRDRDGDLDMTGIDELDNHTPRCRKATT